jgi:hypothetical protein
LKLIREDPATTLVFLDWRTNQSEISPSLNALNVGDIIRHTRLNDSRLAGCFRTINQIFQQLRSDPEAMLFGFDQANHVYIDETTHRSIRSLWESLMRAPAMAAATPPIASPPPLASHHLRSDQARTSPRMIGHRPYQPSRATG